MSYLDPQRWGDVDYMRNALDWTTRKGKLLYPGYEMLRLALVERCAVTGISVPAILQTARASGRIYTGGWFSTFHNTISTLIPKFVNHTNNGGSWNGLATIPLWNEADILVAIGGPSRIPAPDIPLATWSIQQYKILNKLLWIRLAATATDGWARDTLDTYPNYAAAVAAYNVTGWVVRGNGTGGEGRHTIRGFRCSRWKCRATYAAQVFACNVDWYAFVLSPLTPFGAFDDEGLGLTENTYWKYQSDQAFAATVVLLSDFLTAYEGVPPDPGGFDAVGWRIWTTFGTEIPGFYIIPGGGDYKAVTKFDVFGGFKFVDK